MLAFRIYLDFLSLSIYVLFLVQDATYVTTLWLSCILCIYCSVTASQSFLVFHDLSSFEEYCLGVP